MHSSDPEPKSESSLLPPPPLRYPAEPADPNSNRKLQYFATGVGGAGVAGAIGTVAYLNSKQNNTKRMYV